MSLVLLLTVGLAVQTFEPAWGLVVTELLLILLPAVVFVRRKGLSVVEGLRLKPISPLVTLVSVAVGVTAWSVALSLYLLSAKLLGDPPSISMFSVETGSQWAVLLLVAAVLPGICEEALFRGAIQGVCERRGIARAVVIAAVLFAFYHLDPWRLVPTFFLGVVMGALVARTDSIIPAILAHTANNATAVTVDFMSRDEAPETIHLLWYLVPALFVCFSIFLVATRGRSLARSPLADVPAGLSAGASLWFKAALAVGAVFVAIVVSGVISAFDFPLVESSDIAPHLKSGERAVVVLDPQRQLPISVDDVAYYRSAPEAPATMGRVVRNEGDRIWIATPGGEIEMPRAEVIGKVIYPAPVAGPK